MKANHYKQQPCHQLIVPHQTQHKAARVSVEASVSTFLLSTLIHIAILEAINYSEIRKKN